MKSFFLQPFPGAGSLPGLKISVDIGRRSNTLLIDYRLLGRLAELSIAPPAATPARKNELWQETCFELFLACRDFPSYWEFNLSPAGHWNVYRFSSYRQEMKEEDAFERLSFSVRSEPEALLIALELDLGAIIGAERVVEAGVSAVIKQKGGEISYWALAHRGPKADFHRRDGFIVELESSHP